MRKRALKQKPSGIRMSSSRSLNKEMRWAGGIKGCWPLRPVLPEWVVPHMFPLWVENLDTVFPNLEDLAFPMQRFGQFLSPELDETICPINFRNVAPSGAITLSSRTIAQGY